MIKKIITIGALASALMLCSSGCTKEEQPKPASTQRNRYRPNKPAQPPQIENKKILTQIVDVQEITIPYLRISHVQVSKEKAASFTNECIASFRYVRVKGGDLGEEVLIWPKDASYIEKYVPVEISFQTVPDKKINLQNLVSRFYGNSSGLRIPIKNIEVYGIIDADGIKYLEVEQK